MSMTYANEAISQELWYLSQNDKFRDEVISIRQKNRIPITGLQKNIDIPAWKKTNWSMEEEKSFNNDLRNFFLRSRGFKSKFSYEFKLAIGRYILSNDYNNQKAFYMIEQNKIISINDIENKVEVKLYLNFDTTKTQAKELIETGWTIIRKNQRKIAGKRLKQSKNFNFKKNLWIEIKSGAKTEINLEETNEHGHSLYEIRKIIKEMDNRINTSFE